MPVEIVYILVFKMIPLYLLIIVGYIAYRVVRIQRKSVSRMLIYIISPVIVFYGAYSIDFKMEYLLIPPVFFVISSGIALFFLTLAHKVMPKGSTKNLIGLSAGTGNTGYFGLPLIAALFGIQAFSIGVFVQIGITLFEYTLGYYIAARGRYNMKTSIAKMLKLPFIYFFVLGLIFNLTHIELNSMFNDVFDYFRGAYSLLGMMVIGMGIASVKIHSFDYTFLFLALLARIVVWPAVIALIVLMDRTLLHIYTVDVHKVMVIMAIVPLAANLVVFSTELNVTPDKAALAVIISTVLALGYIPFVVVLLFG